MNDIAYIVPEINIVLDNWDKHENRPPFLCYDNQWQEVARCHSFNGMHAILRFSECTPQRPAKAYVELADVDVTIDPLVLGSHEHSIYPSVDGQIDEPLPIPWFMDNKWYSEIVLLNQFQGSYDINASNCPFVIMADSCSGTLVQT